MNSIGLISCTKKKANADVLLSARELYWPSALFRAALTYCERTYDQVFVLSAMHGLLTLDDRLEYYDVTLITQSRWAREAWSRKVYAEIERRGLLNSHFYFHAGAHYRAFLMRWIPRCTVPLAGLGIGQQLSWYKRTTNE